MTNTYINEQNEQSDACKTQYPIVFIHGTGFRHDKFYNYWGRIPKALTQNGATVYYADGDAWGTICDNAQRIKESVLKILSETGAEKVNLIAHSKGGLEARFMICKLGIAEHIASLTTISSPHHGSKTLEIFSKFPKFLLRFVAFFVNIYFRILGDSKPDFFTFVNELSISRCVLFNKEMTDVPEIYYQSFASQMKSSFSDMLLCFPHFILKIIEGENDGIVALESAKWGDFQGVISAHKRRGVSHADVIDMRRMNIGDFDIRERYVEIVKSLKAKKL